MDKREFEKIVREGIKVIPKKFLEKLNNVAIVIEEKATCSQLRRLKIGEDWTLFGLYEGVPQAERWGYGHGEILPDKITIFKNAIEKEAEDTEEIKEIVKNTVWHEIAHHFGMSEREVRDVEKKRRKK